ncbi:hypothetical protein [Nostoc sp. UCD121]|uniref:hypothetical protein n=1 Tax=Nostoc sp. UCD121 TaxID=2681305 RepID=UPI0018172D4A|nr:hypothetical protein [Nostoc sp. UCD121]MBC1224114.1 hypothetical protein [Nostoc sp. UCD120]
MTHTSRTSDIYRLPDLKTSRPHPRVCRQCGRRDFNSGHERVVTASPTVAAESTDLFAKLNDINVYTTPQLQRYGIANPSKIR